MDADMEDGTGTSNTERDRDGEGDAMILSGYKSQFTQTLMLFVRQLFSLRDSAHAYIYTRICVFVFFL